MDMYSLPSNIMNQLLGVAMVVEMMLASVVELVPEVDVFDRRIYTSVRCLMSLLMLGQ